MENINDLLNRLFDNFRYEGKSITPTNTDKKTVPIVLEDDKTGEAKITSLKTTMGQIATFEGKVGVLIPLDTTNNFIFKPLVENKNKDNL